MPSKTFLIALLFVTSLNLTNLPGQDGGCTRRTVPVGVVDREWKFVQGLSATNFRGKLHGWEVEVLSVSLDTSPRHIILLLDASGSMMVPDAVWDNAKYLSEYLIRHAPPGASIAQMAFSEKVLGTAGFDQDRLALLKRLADLVKVCERPRKTRRTALYDTIASARGLLGGLEFGDVIFAVTDGEDNRSRTEAEKVEQNLLRGGIRLFSALFEDQGRRTPTLGSKEIEGAGRLLSMIEATGGNALTLLFSPTSPPNPYPHLGASTRNDAIDLALQRFYQQMGEFYRLELRLPEKVDKPTKWKLEVIEANGRPGRKVEVRYPEQLLPCAKVGP
jgi:hypothetical protein